MRGLEDIGELLDIGRDDFEMGIFIKKRVVGLL
jgi:hypothetical protein